MFLSLEQNLVRFESAVVITSGLPGIGVIPAACQVALGVIQIIASLAAMLVCTPLLWHRQAFQIMCHADEHFLNGLANCVTGVIQAIPIVGLILSGIRIERAGGIRNNDLLQEVLYVGYRSVMADSVHHHFVGSGTTPMLCF